MSKCHPYKLKPNKKDNFTKITWKPDLPRFKMTEFDDDLVALLKKRVVDMCGLLVGCKVFLNGERIQCKNFKEYIDMHLDSWHAITSPNEPRPKLVFEKTGKWEVGFCVSDGSFRQVSFANCISTSAGGTHVQMISDMICNKLVEKLKKKNKGGAAVKANQIRNYFFLFINCEVVNPTFSSQTKETLTSKPSEFKRECNLSDKFYKDVENSGILTNILEIAKVKADKQLSKSDGNKRSRISNSKLTDANKAGTREGHKCTLILTEGDSAMTLAVAGIGAIEGGRDYYGVFPLRGKVLNVRDATIDQISKNAEIQNIKQILGLKHKMVYTAETAKSSLRYGHLMIMTDQDHDGSHIKGLLINFLETQYPSLLRLEGFLVEFITPIVRVFKGGRKNPTQVKDFYTMPEYEYWLENQPNRKSWEHKYYKGLATSDASDARVYFSNLDRHLKTFEVMEEEGSQLIELAFSKKKADDRKEWLRQFQPGTYLDYTEETISYPDFVNKELILFSMADNMRSIPSVIDGLKPGQRKTMFACFNRPFKKELKVLQLAANVSEQTAYQHGETSLQMTIVNLAQNFVGSNNINLLQPNGSFGTRLQGGKDAGSARYIYTQLPAMTRKIFHPQDDALLNYNTDDGKRIDPDFYVPIIPMVLVNGADGIGTGWSTTIPNFNPVDIVANIRKWMQGEEMEEMVPWYRGWNGAIENMGGGKYKFSGIVRQIDDLTVEITELPIKYWTQEFKDRLEEIIKADKAPSFIKDYVDYNTIYKVHFIITMESAKHMEAALAEGLENKFKLTRMVNTTNLVAFDSENRIHRYETVIDIMKEFCIVRLKFYQKRKDYMLAELERQMRKLTNQARFLTMIIKKELSVSNRKKADIIAELKELGFEEFSTQQAKKKGENAKVIEDDEEEGGEDADIAATGGQGYNYLLGMPIWSLTKEKVEKIQAEVRGKEQEVDDLIKKSPKDLWNADLDDFLQQWEIELLEDEKRVNEEGKKKKSKASKLGNPAGAGKKKKGDDEYDDYNPGAAKKKKPAAVKAKPAPKAITAKKEDDDSTESGGAKLAPIFAKAKANAAAAKKTTVVVNDVSADEISDDEVLPSKARKAAPKKIALLDDSEDEVEEVNSDDEVLLSKKRAPATKAAAKPAAKAAPKAPPKKSMFDLSDDDLGTPPPPPEKAAETPEQKKRRETLLSLLSDDESGDKKASGKDDLDDDDSDAPVKKPASKAKAPAKKAEPKAKAAPKEKAPPKEKKAPAKKAEPKPKAAAKPKAAPKAKAKKVELSDDEDGDSLMNGGGDSDVSMDEAPKARPARAGRAAAATKKSYKLVDSEDEDEFGDGDDGSDDFEEDDD